MDIIIAEIILDEKSCCKDNLNELGLNIDEEDKIITKRDLINDGFDCDILINDIKLTNDLKLKKENKIHYLFKNKYNNLSQMFKDCSLLTSINLSYFNTNNAINMSEMFFHCSSLNSINLSNFNVWNVFRLFFINFY